MNNHAFYAVEYALEAALKATLAEDQLCDPVYAPGSVGAEEPTDQRVIAAVQFTLEELDHLWRPATAMLIELLGLAQGEAEDVIVDQSDQLELLGIGQGRSGDRLQGLLEMADPVGTGAAIAKAVE